MSYITHVFFLNSKKLCFICIEFSLKDGRIKERTFVKNYSDKTSQYSHFTFSFDLLKNRMLNMVEYNIPHTEYGIVDKEDNEFKYISVLYGYMNFCGIMEIPTVENFICDIVSESMKNFSERLTNKEFIYRSFLPTGNYDYNKFNIEDIVFYSSKTNNIHNDENFISIKNTNRKYTEDMEEKDLTINNEEDKIKYLKNIAFAYSEFLKKIIFFMSPELMNKIDFGDVNFLTPLMKLLII